MGCGLDIRCGDSDAERPPSHEVCPETPANHPEELLHGRSKDCTIPTVQPRKRAACALIQRPQDGAVLSVSRGHDTSDWGLPGGRVERNETLPEAAERELAEETGVKLHPHSRLKPICNGLSGNHIVTIYSVEGNILIPNDGMRSIPFEGYVDWLPPEELCKSTCTFAEFQRNLFTHFGII